MEPSPAPHVVPETAIQTAADHEKGLAKARERQPQTVNAAPRFVAWTVVLFLVACLAFLATLAELVFIVPGFEKHFLDFKMKLPFITELTISVSRFAVKFWYLAIPAIAVAGVFSFIVRHRVESRMPSVVWFGLLFVIFLAANVVLWASLIVPTFELLEVLGGGGKK